MSSPVCDPRVSWEGCSPDWIHKVQIFYYALCIWSFVTFIACVSHSAITFSRRGIPKQPDLLLVFLLLGSLILCGYSYGICFSRGKVDTFAGELLWSLPVAISVYCHLSLSVIIKAIQTAGTSQLMDPRSVIKKATIKATAIGIIPVLAAFAGAAMLHKYPGWGKYTYLVTMIPSVLVSGYFVIDLYFTLRTLKRVLSSVPKRISFKLTSAAVIQVMWIVVVIVHAASYSAILNISSVAAWMTITALEFVLSSWGMVALADMLMKEEFSSKGIQRLKAKVLIKMEPYTTKGAEVEVLDKTLSGISDVKESRGSKTIGSADSKTETEGEPGEGECVIGGACKPMYDVDIMTAQELAQPIWKNRPKKFMDLFIFPHPVNEWEARTQSLFIALTAITILIVAATTTVYQWWLYAWIVYGYFVRTLCGPRFDPQAWFIVLVVGKILPMPIYVPGPPKRFAQLVCCSVSILALILYTTGYGYVSYWFIALLSCLTLLQSVHQVCAGCFVWHIITLTGFIPEKMVEKSNAEFEIKSDTLFQSVWSRSKHRDSTSKFSSSGFADSTSERNSLATKHASETRIQDKL